MSETPTKVVFDCSVAHGLRENAETVLQRAAAAAAAGDIQAATELLAVAQARLAEADEAVTAFQIVPLDADELAQRDLDAAAAAVLQQRLVDRAWTDLRMRRDRYLRETDWLTLPTASSPTDVPKSTADEVAANQAVWKSYRQQLRDLPANTTDPFTPSWPPPPAAPAVLLT